MTSIIYHDGKLYGDRKVVVRGSPCQFIDEAKVTVSEDGEFAYGSTGWSIRDERRAATEKTIRDALEAMACRLPEKRKDVYDPGKDSEFKSLMGDVFGLVFCTRDQVFSYRSTSGHITQIRPDMSAGTGTGAAFILGMLEVGYTVHRAFHQIGFFDIMTGTKYDKIDLSKLKPFVVRGGPDV